MGNEHSGAVIKYEAPKTQFRNLVRRYFENGKQCDVRQFTEIGQETGRGPECQPEVDQEMKEHRRRSRRKSVRLHSSYAGFTGDGLAGKEELKQIANQRYAATAKRKESVSHSDKHCEPREKMDC